MAQESSGMSCGTKDGGGLCLVVEDSCYLRDIMATYISKLGIEVSVAENGREALEKYLADPQGYRVIFMDLQMPEMNGYEAAERIRSSGCENAGEIPVIAMSGDPLTDVGQFRFTELLQKPFRLQDIDAILDRYK